MLYVSILVYKLLFIYVSILLFFIAWLIFIIYYFISSHIHLTIRRPSCCLHLVGYFVNGSRKAGIYSSGYSMLYVIRFTFYVLHFTFYILRFTFYVLRYIVYRYPRTRKRISSYLGTDTTLPTRIPRYPSGLRI